MKTLFPFLFTMGLVDWFILALIFFVAAKFLKELWRMTLKPPVMPNVVIQRKFAILPVYIRNYFPILGYGYPKWIWFKRYTLVLTWNENLKRYRIRDTYLGWGGK